MSAKRLFDLTVVLLTLPIWLPVLIVLGFLVRVFLGSPILFVQERPGRFEEMFRIYKFRTMTEYCDEEGRLLQDSERLTKFGKFVRASSLDELPELINVIRGEMSLVGPRPLLPEYLPLFNSRQRTRHEVLPGLTGWAQINGRNAISWDERFKLDCWYVENHNVSLDVKILLVTFARVILMSGISPTDEVTMPKFTGNRSQDKSRHS